MSIVVELTLNDLKEKVTQTFVFLYLFSIIEHFRCEEFTLPFFILWTNCIHVFDTIESQGVTREIRTTKLFETKYFYVRHFNKNLNWFVTYLKYIMGKR